VCAWGRDGTLHTLGTVPSRFTPRRRRDTEALSKQLSSFAGLLPHRQLHPSTPRSPNTTHKLCTHNNTGVHHRLIAGHCCDSSCSKGVRALRSHANHAPRHCRTARLRLSLSTRQRPTPATRTHAPSPTESCADAPLPVTPPHRQACNAAAAAAAAAPFAFPACCHSSRPSLHRRPAYPSRRQLMRRCVRLSAPLTWRAWAPWRRWWAGRLPP
jgi:hypothetical protein